MYTSIINNTPQHESEDGYVPCIFCDWSFEYHDEVKAEAINLMQKWNGSNDESDCIYDWNEFVEDAVAIVSKQPYVHCTCANCE